MSPNSPNRVRRPKVKVPMIRTTSATSRRQQKKQRRNLWILRTVLYGTIISAVALPGLSEPYIQGLWQRLLQSKIYTSSTWETILTVFSYTALELLYTFMAINPKEPYRRIDRRQGTSHLWKNGTVRIRTIQHRIREIIEYVTPLLLLDLTMVKKFVGVSREEIIKSGGYDYPLVLAANHTHMAGDTTGNGSETTATTQASLVDGLTGLQIRDTWKVPTLHHFTWSSPVQLVRALPRDAPSSRDLALGVIGAVVLYDFLFYLSHVAMHKVKMLWKAHAFHHKHAEIHAQITNQLSFTERFILVGSANLALHAVSAHPLTRTVFVPIFLYLLVENHSGLDLPYGYDKLLPRGWAAGPEDHAEHHRKGNCNFQPYLTWADRLVGTYSDGRKKATT